VWLCVAVVSAGMMEGDCAAEVEAAVEVDFAGKAVEAGVAKAAVVEVRLVAA
jgi:hypothetical protein